MPRLSPEKRARICTLLDEGYSTRSIAAREGVSNVTAWKTGKHRDKDRGYKDLPRPGRPRLFTRRAERRIVRLMTSSKCNTVVEVQAHLRTKENLHVSVNTIRHTLQRNGLVARVKKKKPLLTKRHRQSRLAFAKKYKDWTIEDWRHIVWSDESKFQLFGSDGRQWYWKKPNEPLSTRHIRPTVKHGGGNIMVWGCFTSSGIGYLCRIDGGLDGELYRKILNDEFIATLNWYNMDKEQVVFQHDNDPKHTANLTKQWFVDHNIKVLDWPSQSPDLNPIEHLWNEVDRHLRNLPSQITSKSDLWDKLQGVWEGINLETCTKLIDTMPERIRDVLKANGGYTRW